MTAVRRAAKSILTRAVRGRTDRGEEWGEALLAEFDRTATTGEAVRWAASGSLLAWRRRALRMTAPWPTSRRGRHVARAVTAAMVSIALGTAANAWVLTVRQIPSGSMAPTLAMSSRVLVDKLAFHVTGVHRGDIVTITVPSDAGGRDDYVKRIVGLPGDRLSCVDGHVVRNGARLDEPYLRSGTTTECSPTTVPNGEVFVLGDNRTNSMDSRQLGLFRTDQIVGHVVTRF